MSIFFGSVSGNYSDDPNKINADTELTTKSLTTTSIDTTNVTATNGNFAVLKINDSNVSTLLSEKQTNLNNTTDLTVKGLTATSIKIGVNDVSTLLSQK